MLKNAKAELKSKNLPLCFTPRRAPSGMTAVNVNQDDVAAVTAIMIKHGYQVSERFHGVDTDYQICFKPVRA